MDTKPVTDGIRKVDGAYREKNRGEQAQQVLQLLDPMLEKRLGVLLSSFRQCPPELGPLLDFRAQICEVWYLRKELQDAVSLGKYAEGVLEQMMSGLAHKLNNNQRPVTGHE